MSTDENSAPTDTDETQDPTQTEDTSPEEPKDYRAEADKWKALARKHETEAKNNRAAATKLAELEERDKSEQQRLADRAEAAEKRAAELELTTLRQEIGSAKGLTASQARRLYGTTREELEADADDLLAAFPAPKPSSGSADQGVRSSGVDYSTMSDAELQKATRGR